MVSGGGWPVTQSSESEPYKKKVLLVTLGLRQRPALHCVQPRCREAEGRRAGKAPLGSTTCAA